MKKWIRNNPFSFPRNCSGNYGAQTSAKHFLVFAGRTRDIVSVATETLVLCRNIEKFLAPYSNTIMQTKGLQERKSAKALLVSKTLSKSFENTVSDIMNSIGIQDTELLFCSSRESETRVMRVRKEKALGFKRKGSVPFRLFLPQRVRRLTDNHV